MMGQIDHQNKNLSLPISSEEWIEQLEKLAQIQTSQSGKIFLNQITIELTKLLNCNYAFIGMLAHPKSTIIQTVSFSMEGKISQNFQYDLTDTPCENVVGKKTCSYKSKVADLFPRDIMLEEMGIHAYIGVPLFDSHGTALGIIATLYKHPIEDTRLAEIIIQMIANKAVNEIEILHKDKSLKDSQENFKELFDNAPYSLWEEDLSQLKGTLGKILKKEKVKDWKQYFEEKPKILQLLISQIKVIMVNDETLRLFQTNNKESFINQIEKTISENAKQFIKTCLISLMKGDRKGIGIVETNTFKEKEITIEVKWIVPKQYIENWEKVYLAIQDITDRVEMEENLRQAEKMQAIGQLAGGIAHDFNNQLTGIVGYTEILKEELSDSSQLLKYTEKILTATKRSYDLNSQLLAFAHKGKYISRSLNIHDILHEIIDILERTFNKQIIIKAYLEAQNPMVQGDPTQLQNAFLNIAINSRDAMKNEGEMTISTSVVQLTKEYCSSTPYEIEAGKYIEISFSDTGIGMDEETQKRIFEPFFTTKKTGQGTGMGLASVYGTVKSHNGIIHLSSEPEQGTTMDILLPQLSVKNIVKKTKIPTKKIEKDSAHILLIEDEEIVLDTTKLILEKNGYKVTSAMSGTEAIAIYRKMNKEIDLVILDMIMPGLNGKQTYLELKKINPRLKALLSSGYSIDDEAQDILNHGVQSFIQKPFRKNELLRKVSEIIHTKSST